MKDQDFSPFKLNFEKCRIQNSDFQNHKGRRRPTFRYFRIHDDVPTFVFCPNIEDTKEDVPSLYVSLNIHEIILHNSMLDSGASHNSMSKAVVECLGLDIMRPYKYIFYFDSRKMRCLV